MEGWIGDPNRISLRLLPLGPDRIGKWFAHRQPSGSDYRVWGAFGQEPSIRGPHFAARFGMHPTVFAHSYIDRHGIRRRDAEWLAALDPASVRILPVIGQSVPVNGDGTALTYVDVPGPRLFLGMTEGLAHFAVAAAEPPPGSQVQDLRQVASLLPAAEASLAAYAIGLTRWHERHGFCGVCGQPTQMVEAGHKRVCPSCAAEHFPRTDPAVIVLIEHEDACLLARNARHRPGMHSTLAGFVEPGESLEAAVQREIFEEAAVRLTDIAYQYSQPWPFPASLMIGFRATAAGRDFTVDGEEIVAAAWFTRADLKPYIKGGTADEAFSLPGKLSISYRLIEEWYYES